MTHLVVDLPDPIGSRVILLGVSDYVSLPEVPAAARNLHDMRDVFTRTDMLGLPDEHVITIDDATLAGPAERETAITFVRDVAAAATDSLIFYFAGHGLLPEPGYDDGLYLALPRTVAGQSYSALPFHEVGVALDRSPAVRKIVVVDACYAGWALDETVTAVGRAAPNATHGVVMLASSPRTRPSGASDGRGNTAFTGELLRILRSGVQDGPELIDLATLYMELRLAHDAGRIAEPELSSRGLGSHMALVRNPAYRGATAVVPASVDLGRLIEVLEQILASETAAMRPLQDAFREVAKATATLRWSGAVGTTVVFRLQAFVREISYFVDERPDIADLPAIGREQLEVLLAGRRRLDAALVDFRAETEMLIREAYGAAASTIPQAAEGLQPRDVQIGVLIKPTRARELFDDLATQLTERVDTSFRSEVRRALRPLFKELLTAAGSDADAGEMAEFAAAPVVLSPADGRPEPGVVVVELLRDVAAFEPLLQKYVRVLSGPEQIRTVRHRVVEAARRVIPRPDVAAKRVEDIREQAEWRAVRIAEGGWLEMANRNRTTRLGVPTIRELVNEAETLVRQLLEDEG